MLDRGITLTGLDGANPLGFLAALGTLQVLDYRARQRGTALPRLSWANDGCWRPTVHGVPSMDTLIGEVVEDLASWADNPCLLLAYDESGEELLDPREPTVKATRDLKPRPGAMRAFLDGLARGAEATASASAPPELRRSLDMAAAYGSELIQDNNGNTKPTAFHFTAGQQQFLKAVADLQSGVTAEDFEEALIGPWRRESTLPNMSWDSTNARLYALRANNPSGDKKTTIAGADWLAYVGLATLPSFPRGSRLATTGVAGGWKDSAFTWPIWTCRATRRVVGSLVATPDAGKLTPVRRRELGIAAVFTSRIARTDQGGYGSFSPADVR